MHAEQPHPAPPGAAEQQRLDHLQSIERLFREHNETLIRFLRARLRSYQEAREVAQEAYVRLLSLDETGAVSYLRAFLFKTAENLAVDRMRREELRGTIDRLPLFQELVDARTPERQTAAAQTVHRLERVVAALPAKCRQAFMLKCFQGQDVASIARELKLSKRMVREYIARALLQCRTSLDLSPHSTEDSHGDRED